MPVLIQICAVIVTIAVSTIAVSMLRFSARVSQLSEDIRLWLVQVRQVTGEAQEAIATVREIVQPVRRVVDRFERLGERTASLSSQLLDEVEAPIRTAVAVARGVRTGTAQFIERLTSRFKHGRPATDGGVRYE